MTSRHLPLAAGLLFASAFFLTWCAPALNGDDDVAPADPPGIAGLATSAPPPATPRSAGIPPEWNELAPAALVEACATPGQGEVLTWTDGAAWSLPLLSTDVDVVISGMVADITVVQAFANPFEEAIEAVYLFPLPDDAAVDGMTLRIGDRVIEGTIHEREEAAAIYEQAKSEGRVASRIDQERPNIFKQSVANLMPGAVVEVSIHVVQPLIYDADGYSWAFPLVVGPRYVPADDDPNPRAGDLADLPAARAALDAPYSPTRTGNDVNVRVSLDAGVPIRDVRSPSHDLHVSEPSPSRAEVSLATHDRIPNKDFVLRWTVAGGAPEVAVLADAHDGQGVFMLMIQPPADAAVTPETVIPKEMVFVVDTSCSMSGFPLDKAKDAMRFAIDGMNPDDRFLVMDFNDTVSSLAPRPLSNTAANRRRGRSYVDGFSGSGGTRMLDGIEASLDLPADPALLRTVLFLTDGYIGNEADILASIEQRLGARTRLFSLGIGSSVNRYLLDRMAKVGRGSVDVVLHAEDADASLRRFYDRIRNPILSDLSVEVVGVKVMDLTPDPLPELFTGQPIVLFGRYEGGGVATVTVTGLTAAGPFEQVVQVALPSNAQDHPGIGSLWARKTIEDLELRNHGGDNEALTDEMTDLALTHGLVTRRTSFVAVDTVISNPSGESRRQDVPLETPEGVDLEAASCGVFGSGSGASSFGSGSGSGGYGYGAGGLGMTGMGSGGGGSAMGLGGGMLGTKGRSGGGFYGKSAPAPASAAPRVTGSVDKSVIDRVIRRHLNQVRYCYEKELQLRPDTAGKVVV